METPIFQDVTNEKPDRNTFDLSHQVLLTAQMGDLIPTLCQEVLPGDKFRIRSEIFARMMALKHPIMQKVDIYAHYFFVPNRLLWNANNQNDSWQAFITGGRDGNVEPVPPMFTYSRIGELSGPGNYIVPNSLLDYLGYPVYDNLNDYISCWTDGALPDEPILAYPLLAYNLIYDNYYRDQNLSEPVFKNEEVLSGGDIFSGTYLSNIRSGYFDLLSVKKRAWRKDYFTSSLPWAQRGEPVTLPIGTFAPLSVSSDSPFGNGQTYLMPTAASILLDGDRSYVVPDSTYPVPGSGSLVQAGLVDSGGSSVTSSLLGIPINRSTIEPLSNNGLGVDLTESTSVTVNQLRASIKIQEWLERNATGGARYVEQIYAHFGVVVPDSTMQRPIYLGGGKQIFQISEVTQTSESTQESPLGSYSGQGYSLGDHIGFDGYQFNEHGWIMCIMSIIPKASYMQGLNRKFSRFNKFDYYFPEFAHLGEQEVKNKELVLKLDNSDGNNNNGTFGYQSRYAEYRWNDDRVCGDFRDTLIDWHLGRKFNVSDGDVVLSQDFIEVQSVETNRIFAYTAADTNNKPIMVQLYHDIQAIRPMPVFATPWI